MFQSIEYMHCPNGHEYTEENTARDRYGYRRCRTCTRETGRRQSERRMAERHHMHAERDRAAQARAAMRPARRDVDRNTFDLWTAIHPEPQADDAPRLGKPMPFGGMGAR